jgi:hypothetical protein
MSFYHKAKTDPARVEHNLKWIRKSFLLAKNKPKSDLILWLNIGSYSLGLITSKA